MYTRAENGHIYICAYIYIYIHIYRLWEARLVQPSNTLQHAATHCNHCNTLGLWEARLLQQHACNTLQHIATHCNSLRHTARHCKILLLTVNHSNTLLHTATHCTQLHHTATDCNTCKLAHMMQSFTYTAQREKERETVCMHAPSKLLAAWQWRFLVMRMVLCCNVL